MIAATIDVAVRIVVVAALAYASAVAGTAWAVRGRRINPFGAWPKLIRRISDPVLRMLERRVVRLGGNPQDASLWLVAIVVLGGLLLISLVHWLIGLAYTLGALGQASPRGWARFAVSVLFNLVMLALFVRVISSWISISPYAGWMRPFMILTNWIIEPIRRILPPMGMIDFSPMVAWIVLWLARGVVLGMI
ncbi:MAG: YggT family protein [Gemmatimonadales bacterium]